MTIWLNEYCTPARRVQRLLCWLVGHREFQETPITIYCLRCWRVGKALTEQA